MIRTLAAALLAAVPAHAADDFVSNPGYCALPDGEAELAGQVYLTPREILTHWAGCTWSDPVELGQPATRSATCDDGASQWSAQIRFGALADRAVQVLVEPERNLPRYYFPCSLWAR